MNTYFCTVGETRKYDLQELEGYYRDLTTTGNRDAVQRMRSVIANIRYDLGNDCEVIMEYRDGMDVPMVMRILRNEKDLDRWVEQRFIRLAEFSSW